MATRNPYGMGGWWLEEQEYAQLLAAERAKEEAERERDATKALLAEWDHDIGKVQAERDAEVKRAVEAMRERDCARNEAERRAQENAALQDRMHAVGDGLAGLAPAYQRIKAERDAATTALRAAEAEVDRIAGEERERCMRAMCAICRGDVSGYEVEAFQRDVTGEWAHRWGPSLVPGSSLCQAAAIRALPKRENG